MSNGVRRIAMWSGPRNLSTAMMRSFGSRQDCAVSDEPFYAAYLATTGLDHPMREQVMASQPQDAETVAAQLLGPVPHGRSVWYQKHMSHHMVDGFPLAWMDEVTNVFLLRSPARVLASYAQKRESVSLADVGFEGQAMLFDRVAERTGRTPVVIEAEDIRREPERMLRRLCAAIELDWDPAMLAWPKGQHKDDGVWAPHWYGAIFQSTGFEAPPQGEPEVPPHLRPVAEAAEPYFRRMQDAKLQ